MANPTGKGGWRLGESGNPAGRGGFRPGVSGNPGGRPKEVREVKVLAREHTSEALDTLAKIMLDPKAPAAARVSACRELLDRGYGRPESAVDAKVETQSTRLDYSMLTETEKAELDRLTNLMAPFLDKIIQGTEGSSVN